MFKIHEIKYLLSPSHLELKKKTKQNNNNNNNNNKITSTYSTNIQN